MFYKYGFFHSELILKEVDCESVFNILLYYLLNYELVLSFGIATIDEYIVKVLDTSFHVR